MHPSVSFFKALAFGGVFLALIGFSAFFRYFYSSFASPPVLLVAENNESPFTISKNGSFVLEFDQRMKKESVESAISIQPEVPFTPSWDGRKLFIKPDKALQENTTYYLSLGRGPKSILGKPLLKTYLLKYELGDDPRLLKIFPETETLLPDEKIILMFSDPMVGEGEVGKPVEPTFLRLTPFADGSWIWKNSRVLTWSPKSTIPLSTRFHLESVGDMETYGKAPIKEKIERTFQTERFRFLEPEESEPIKVAEPMVLEFNQQVGPRNLEEHITVMDASGKKVEKIFITERRGASRFLYEIRTAGNWAYNEEYQLQVSSELMPEVGNLGLEKSIDSKMMTEEILSEATFRYSDEKTLLHSSGVMKFWMRQSIPLEDLKNSIHFLPKIPFDLKISEEGGYELLISEVSQIRENTKFIITPGTNSELQKILKSPIQYSVKEVEKLEIGVKENSGMICVFSNYPLTAKSVVALGNKTWRLEKGDKETCESQDEYLYSFRKQLLEPSREISLKIFSEDVFNQKDEREYATTTPDLKAQDIVMRSGFNNFYVAAKTKQEMKFPYSTTNVTRVNIQVCKISSELAVSIEGSYEEKWNSFLPSAEKCLKYKSYFEEIIPEWGMEQKHELDIEQVLGEISSGLYYVHVSTPSFFDGDGRALQASGVLNYNQWNIFSKRGESSLIWVTENDKPVSNVIINLYSSDGSLLVSGRTDSQGIYYEEKNKVKYEFIVAKKGEDEALLNVFYQNGLEPNRFSVPSNLEESPYLYQFYLEEGTVNQKSMNGVFILKEKDGSIPKSPKISGATVTLYDSEEQLLWRQHEPMDDFGNLFFEIRPSHPLLDGKYFLGVCLGLHEGVCHGTFLWTTYFKGYQQDNTWKRNLVQEDKISHLLEIDTKKEYKPGDEVSIRIKNLVPKVPALITLERDLIYWKKMIIPQTTEEVINVKIIEEMIPEIVATIYQPNAETSLYDMKMVGIQRDFKKLTYQRSNSETDYWILPDGKKAEEISQITFELETNKPYDDGLIFRSFYPRQGTSIITSSLGTKWKNEMEGDQSNQLFIELIPDLVVIDGVLRREPVKQSSDQSFYFIAHDKNGNFGNTVISGVHHEEKKITIDMSAPSFLRTGDQVIFSVDLQNNFDENKNLQLVSRSDALKILNGESFFLGLAGHQKKTLHIATTMTEVRDVIPLYFDLYEKDVLEAEYSTEIPVITTRLDETPSDLLIYEAPQGRGTIKIPFPEAAQWESHLVISTSPLSYILENIQMLLKKESLSFDETVFKRTIEANYSSLMKESFDDHETLRGIIEKKTSVDNFLYYLGERQKNDGGWSYFPEETESDPTLSSWIAKSVATLEQVGFDIPEGLRKNITTYLKQQLDERVNERIRGEISNTDISEEKMFQELLILNALSSFTPSGISYANSWYNAAEKMPNHSLVLLLLTLEDYRDAQISGMNYKIEELTQILTTRQEKIQNQVWLRGDSEKKFATDFLVTSWYLEALIRQSSARSEVPSIITWLVKNKYLQSHQSQKDQFSFLQAMASYLRIYQEEVSAGKITVVFGKQLNKTFSLLPEKKFQSFFMKEIMTTSEDSDDLYIDFSSDNNQPLFLELNWKKQKVSDRALYNGITVDQSFDIDAKWTKGTKVKGEISVIVSEPLQNVVITHPIISAARDVSQMDSGLWKVKTLGKDEKWYLFPELPAGETIIPFEWELTQAGVYITPRIQAYAMDKPKTLSTSNTMMLEIRNGE